MISRLDDIEKLNLIKGKTTMYQDEFIRNYITHETDAGVEWIFCETLPLEEQESLERLYKDL